MDKAEFDALMANEQTALGSPAQPGSPSPAAPAPNATADGTATPTAPDAAAGGGSTTPPPGTVDQALQPQADDTPLVGGMKSMLRLPGVNQAARFGAGFAAGEQEGVFQTKDFLFGTTPPDERSPVRQLNDATLHTLSNGSMLGGVAEGLGQFAIGMIGAGKIKVAAEALPWFGAGVRSFAADLPKATEAIKAAWAGATAFDPHGQRLSNLVQDTPLANPVNEWLASKPGDSEAEGRVKNALESIGMDATVGGVFLGATKIWKYLRAGDAAGAKSAAEALQQEIDRNANQPATTEAHNAQLVSDAQAPQGDAGAGGGEPDATVQQAPDATGAGGVGDAGNNPAGGQPVAEGQPGVPQAEPVANVQPDAAHPAALDGMPDRTVGTPNADAGGGGVSAGGDGGTVGAGPVELTPNARTAAAAAGTELPNPQPRIRLSQENTEALVKSMSDDSFAMSQFGGWYQALEGGHVFGRGEGIPWQRMGDGAGGDVEVNNMVARITDTVQSRIDSIKGGAVLTDKKVTEAAGRFANLFNVDPASVLGMIQSAGKGAANMSAMMETGFLVTNRMMQDVHALGARISMGDFLEFGSRDAAIAELQKRSSIAASMYASTKSMVSNSARTMRRMQFATDPNIVAAMKTASGEDLLKLIQASEGDPKQLAKALNPGLLKRITDYAQFLLVNNLVSGPKTQLINMTTNAYMLGVRPLEKILGASYMGARGQAGASRVYREAIRQYVYMGANFMESWKAAKDAFVLNDSVLSPHHSEVHTSAGLAPQNLEQGLMGLKPMTSPQALAGNAGKIATLAIGLPTRSLGFVDELMKQITYRSKVAASAYVDGLDDALGKGLKGDAAKDYVKGFVDDRIGSAFDDSGRALDPKALREAQIATFQQELLPNSFGKDLQLFASKHPGLRLMIPFIKTPTNVMRYGWKMTPLLNMAQTEFREALSGMHGAEAKASSVGQMTMGMLFMGTAAYSVSQGAFTGGGPSDPKAKAALMSTGWQPYSLVTQNADGSKTYIPYGRLDPVAIPMGIVADLMDAYHNIGEQDNETIPQAIGALTIAMAKQFTDKTYLQGINQMMQAMQDPDRSANRVAGQMAANFVPYSAAMRQLNPDPLLHDARTMTDKVLSTIPGLSDKVPLRYDPFGQPVQRPGLWSSDDGQVLSAEVQRLAIETGHTIETPGATPNGVDLRGIQMETGKNAYEQYQLWAGNPGQGMSLSTVLAKRIQSEAYQLAPDGDVTTRGTRLWMLSGIVSNYRERALKMLKRDKAVRDAFRAADLKAMTQFRANIAAKRSGASLNALEETFGATGQ